MKFLSTIIVLVFLFFLIPFLSAVPTQAQFSRTEVKLSEPVGSDILPGAGILQSQDIKTSFLFSKLIPFVIQYAIRLALALAVIGYIVVGYQYLTAYGDEEQHKKALKNAQFISLGLVLALTAYGIVKIITMIKIM